MKLTLERIADGDEEVIIRYYEMKEEIEAISGIVQGTGLRIPAIWEGQTLLLLPEVIYYIENVDGITYAYLLCRGVCSVSILSLCEMILTAYFVGYLQIYVFHDFDETEKFGKREAVSAFLCTCIYAAVSGVFGWFEGNVWVTALFIGYIFLCYLCVYLINKIRRKVDTDRLNDMLASYKKEGEAGHNDGTKG